MADTESDNEPDVLLEGCHELTQDDSSPVIDSAEEYPFIYLKHSKSEYTTKISWNHFLVLSLGSEM